MLSRVFRKIDIHDGEALLEIIAAYPMLHWNQTMLQDTLSHITSHSAGLFNHRNQLISFCIFSQQPDEAELLLTATRLDHINQGWASDLLKTTMTELMPRIFFLEVRSSNASAQHLYRSLGFIAHGKRKAYYRDGEDAILYTRPINT